MEYPSSSYIKTETYYQGNLITSDYFDKNQDLFIDYPSKSEVASVHTKIRQTQKDNVHYLIKISEKGIEVIES
jgi:hypothetical protein